MNWSEAWTLGFHATGAKAITGPSLYGEQTVEVVSKLEAEQAVETARKDQRAKLEDQLLSDGAVWGIRSHLAQHDFDNEGLPLHVDIRDALKAAMASHPTPDGEAKSPTNSGQDWMQTSLATVLRHFESEANAADELSSGFRAGSEPSVRYRTERDTYRYVLRQIAEATPDGPASPVLGDEGTPAYLKLDPDEVRDFLDSHGEEEVVAGTKALVEATTEVCPECRGDFSSGGYDEPEVDCKRCENRGRVAKAVLGDEERERLKEIASYLERMEKGTAIYSPTFRGDAAFLRKLAQGEERDV